MIFILIRPYLLNKDKPTRRPLAFFAFGVQNKVTKVPTLYIKISKGYTPEGTGNKKKDIDLSHSRKRNLLLRIK